MEQAKMDRISELTRLAKERPLTAAETAERQALRQEYVALWRRSAAQMLDNTWVEDEHGNREKLRRKGERE